MAQLLLQRGHDAAVLGHAAGHDDVVPHADAAGQAADAAGDGLVDAVDDVALIRTLRQGGDFVMAKNLEEIEAWLDGVKA